MLTRTVNKGNIINPLSTAGAALTEVHELIKELAPSDRQTRHHGSTDPLPGKLSGLMPIGLKLLLSGKGIERLYSHPGGGCRAVASGKNVAP
jgi:hypothetical protein